MSARDFINETLLRQLERELADEAKGNKHYLAGFAWSRSAALAAFCAVMSA